MLRASHRVAAAALAALLSPAARAASERLVTPTSILLNYDHALLGPVEGLEAGAFTARAADASATWYNPAGLASINQLRVIVTSSSFGLTSLRLDGFGTSVTQSTFGILPGFIGIVFGPPVLQSKTWRFGASVTTQRSWRPSIDALFQDDSGGTTPRFTYSSQVSITTVRPGVALGHSLLPNLRLGLGLEVAITGIVGNVAISNARGTASAAEGDLLRSERMEATTWHVLGNIGVQWEPVPGVIVGGVFKTPGGRLYGQGLFSLEDLQATATGFSSVSAFDRSARYSLPLPLEVDFGVAYSADWGGLEADVRIHGGTSLQPLVTSNVPVTTAQAGVVTQSVFPQILFASRTIANFSLGARLVLSPAIQLHAGLFSDASPVADSSSPVIFPQVDVYGATTGASITNEHLSAALGLAYFFGRSESFALAPDLGGPTAVRLHVEAFSGLLSFSYRR